MALKEYDLKHYTNELRTLDLLAEEKLLNSEKIIVSGLEFNSKKVKPGTLFICKGANFKKEYLIEAIERGAIGYVAEKNQDVGAEVPYVLVSDIQEAMAPLAEIFYNSPRKN